MKLLLISALLLLSCIGCQPSVKPEGNNHRNTFTDSNRINAGNVEVREFSADSQLLAKRFYQYDSSTSLWYLQASEKLNREALKLEAVYYYSNGKTASLGYLKKLGECHVRDGIWQFFDFNGVPERKERYQYQIIEEKRNPSEPCSGIWQVIYTEYLMNGAVAHSRSEAGYYDTRLCRCGTWQYFGEKNEIKSEDIYAPCQDTSIICSIQAE